MPPSRLTYQKAALMSPDEVLAELASDRQGLSASAARRRLARFGGNNVSIDQVTARAILLRQVRSPFFYILAAAVVIASYTGQRLDAILITSFILLNVVLGFFQEYRAEQAARLLRKYWKSTARVVRGGQEVRLDSADLVPGDIVRLRAGDRVAADLRLLTVRQTAVDESVLTGESGAVAKTSEAMADRPAGYHQAANIGFAGTSLVAGEAEAVVIATGRGSSLGTIVGLAGVAGTIGTFEREIARFSMFILRLVAVTLLVILALNLAIKGLGQIGELTLFVIALTIGVVPEALPVVLTVTHSRAALRMARRNVIVKRLSAVDDLGSVDVLCVDKTGTLTKNELAVAKIEAADPKACLLTALLGGLDGGPGQAGSPRSFDAARAFDLALWRQADQATARRARSYRLLDELPFDPQRKRGSVLVESPDGQRTLVVRGAPEDIIKDCRGLADPLNVGRLIEREGLAGRRVIAVASKTRGLPAGQLTAADETGLEYVGLISFEDPLKSGAAQAVRRARSLQVAVKMLTGDAPQVAGAVGLKLGLIGDPSEVMTGAEFEALPAAGQMAAVESRSVFARVDPEQKFRIMGLLQEKGMTLAFLGEGFNDVPGLKRADVGIAVENASDIAKEVSDVILTRKSLGAIIEGIAVGRRNFANVIKYLKITLASNFGNFYSVAIASLFVPFLPMLPVQILLLNLMTDAPMIAIAADSVPVGELKRPSHYDARTVIMAATILGVVSSAFDFLAFGVFHRLGAGPLRTLWFMESALTELVLIFSLRTVGPFYRGSPVPKPIAVLIGLVVAVCLGLPFSALGRSLFGFVRPSFPQVMAVLGIVAAYFLATEVLKLKIYANGHSGRRRSGRAKSDRPV